MRLFNELKEMMAWVVHKRRGVEMRKLLQSEMKSVGSDIKKSMGTLNSRITIAEPKIKKLQGEK